MVVALIKSVSKNDRSKIASSLIQNGNADFVRENLELFKKLSPEVAFEMIEAKQDITWTVGMLNRFGWPHRNSLAFKMVEAGMPDSALWHLKECWKLNFGIDYKKLVFELAKSPKGCETIRENINYLKPGLTKDFALTLTRFGFGAIVSDNIPLFSGLDQEVALELIRNEAGDAVLRHLKRFKNTHNSDIIEELIRCKQGHILGLNLNKFKLFFNIELEPGLREEDVRNTKAHVVKRLLETKQADVVADHLEYFGTDKAIVADALIKNGPYEGILNRLKKLGLTRNESIKKLPLEALLDIHSNHELQDPEIKTLIDRIATSRSKVVIRYNVEKFSGYQKYIATTFLAQGYSASVHLFKAIDQFKEITHKELFEICAAQDKVIVAEEDGPYATQILLDKVTPLDIEPSIIKAHLIATSQFECFAKNLKHFKDQDLETGMLLVANGCIALVSAHMKSFDSAIRTDLVKVVIEQGGAGFLAKNFSAELGISSEDLYLKLVSEGQAKQILANISRMGKPSQKVIDAIYEKGDLHSLASIVNLAEAVSEHIAISLAKMNYDRCFSGDIKHFANAERHKANALAANVSLRDYFIAPEAFDGISRDDAAYEHAFKKLAIEAPWRDMQNVANPFKQLAERLGYRFAFLYANRSDVSRHDIFFAIPKILALFDKLNNPAGEKASTKTLRNILTQVQKDDSTYNAGKSYKHLNEIAQSGLISPAELLKKIQADPELSKAISLISRITEFKEKGVLSSWQNFKAYTELAYRIEKENESFKKIISLRENGQQKLAEYFEKIAFHKASKVNLADLITFASDNPLPFLENSDVHADVNEHNRKKPSNYVEIPNLGLSAVELRNALVDGKLDGIQVISPHSIEYNFSRPGMLSEFDILNTPIKELISKALGSKRDKILGILSSSEVPKLFANMQRIINAYHASQGANGKVKFIEEFIKGEYVVDASTELILRQAIRGSLVKEDKVDLVGEKFIASIHPKSSPEAVLAGNDTACCMPFGSGKNNVYMFNLNCVQFTVQQVMFSNEVRTVGQSIVTVDLDSGVAVPTLLAKVNAGNAFTELVPEGSLGNTYRVLVCDSIERNDNFTSSSDNIKKLQVIYEDFFAQLLAQLPSQFSDGHDLNKQHIPVSTQFPGPFAKYYEETENRLIPLAPMSYSDNNGKNIFNMPPTRHRVQSTVRAISQVTPTRKTSGKVNDLTFLDTLHVTYLESKAYADAPNLITALHNIQNGIMAKDIANASRGNAELSVKYISRSGQLRAYMIAYEGIYDKTKEACVYISDFAAAKRNSYEAGKVLLEFMNRYKENYLDKGNLLPIYMEAREETSYKLLIKQLKNISERLGCKFNVEESGVLGSDSSARHQIKISVAVN